MKQSIIPTINSLINSIKRAAIQTLNGPSLRDIIEHEYSAAYNTVSECAIAIQKHEYIKHMARAKMNAIEEWEGR